MFLFKRNGYYYIEYLDESTQTKKRVSTKCSKKSEALIFLNQWKQKLDEIKQGNIKSIKDFSDVYETHIKDTYSEKYLISVKLTLRKFMEVFPSKDLNDLTVKEVEQFISHTYSKKKYAGLLYYKTLKAAFSKACVWGYMDQNPFKKFKAPKSPKRFPLFMSSDEFERIITFEPNNQIRNLYELDFNTGLRLGEIINLEWIDINDELTMLTVANKNDFTTKSKEERLIPLNEKARLALQRQKMYSKQSNNYVFTNNLGRKFELDYVSRSFKKCIKAAGANIKLHFHSIRHSFASNLAQKGVSLYVIKSLLGHASVSTTEIYAHLDNASLRQAINLLD